MFTRLASTASAAPPLFLFIATVGTGVWAATSYEDCKAEGLNVKECGSKLWREREGVPTTQELYNQRFNG